jgi:hypothetical protein
MTSKARIRTQIRTIHDLADRHINILEKAADRKVLVDLKKLANTTLIEIEKGTWKASDTKKKRTFETFGKTIVLLKSPEVLATDKFTVVTPRINRAARLMASLPGEIVIGAGGPPKRAKAK